MILTHTMYLLAFAPPPSPDGTAPNPTGQMVQMVGMMVIMGLMFYFVLIRPQQRKAKEHEKLLSTVKAGDKVVTTSGIVGVVVAVKDKQVSLRSADSKMDVLKSSIGEILERAGGAAASDK
jgi:preprotein translocase subunit YajC